MKDAICNPVITIAVSPSSNTSAIPIKTQDQIPLIICDTSINYVFNIEEIIGICVRKFLKEIFRSLVSKNLTISSEFPFGGIETLEYRSIKKFCKTSLETTLGK